MSEACTQIREGREWKKNVQRASYGYHWNLTLAIVLSATSFINFRGNKIMINIEN